MKEAKIKSPESLHSQSFKRFFRILKSNKTFVSFFKELETYRHHNMSEKRSPKKN